MAADDTTQGDAMTPAGPEDALATDVELDAVDVEASAEVMNLLSQHVPLALLADLALPTGPASPAILEEEGLPEVAWWEPGEGHEGAEEPSPAVTDG